MTYSFKKQYDTAFLYPASIIKILTAIVAREWVLDSELDATVTVTSADMHPPTTAGLQSGDVVSWRDLFYGLMVPSGNDASLTIGRIVGERILASESAVAGTGLSRFIVAMNVKLAALGFNDAIAGSTHGVDINTRLSALHVATLMRIAASDAFLKTVMGTLSRNVTITGVNARTYTITHTINPVGSGNSPAIPEFVCGKSGGYVSSGIASYSLAIIWKTPANREICSVVIGSSTSDNRYIDIRKIIDFELSKL